MLNYEEQEKMLNDAKKIKIGSIITCKGITCTVKEIYYKDVYIELDDNDEYKVFYDAEFRDTNGILRNWKSRYDGGYVVK